MRKTKKIDEIEKKIKKTLNKPKVDKTIKIIQTILIITLIITLTYMITKGNQEKKLITPTNETIKKTCNHYGLEEAGYTINYKEGKVKILCSKTYMKIPQETTPKIITKIIKN